MDTQSTQGLAAGSKKRPHILLVVLDDAGYHDMGDYTAPVPLRCQMPAVSSLISQGVKLKNFYVMPVCSPTRAALMSGRHPIRYGAQTGVASGPAGARNWLPDEEPFLAERMKKAGYRTKMTGKWHLGRDDLRHVPSGRGFDEFYGKYEGAGDHWTHNFDSNQGRK